MKIKPGSTYGRASDGRIVEVNDTKPTHWLCRRVADFPPGRIPNGAGFSACTHCGAHIVFNPARSTASTAGAMKICMQCGDVEPLPFEDS